MASGCGTLLDSREPSGICGDGVVQRELGEECDGSAPPGERCSSGCRLERCGNGIIEGDEQCDDGAANDNSADCTRQCQTARCGDGWLHTRGVGPSFEVCDDGNQISGDGCADDCRLRGRLSLLVGSAGGRGVAAGVGSAARVGGVGAIVSGPAAELYFWDNGACAVRHLDLGSGRVSTVAGVEGGCDPVRERDGPGDQARFRGTGTGIRPRDEHELFRIGETLYAIYRAGNKLRSIDLRAGHDHSVSSCAFLGRDDQNRALGQIQAVSADPSDSSGFFVADDEALYRVALPCDCSADRCTITRVAANLGGVRDIARDAAGDVYVASETRIVHVAASSSGQLTPIAGSSERGAVNAARGADARFSRIAALALAPGVLYVADEAVRADPRGEGGFDAGWAQLRSVELSGDHAVRALAGISGAVIDPDTSESDGFGAAARFVSPRRMAIAAGTLYIGEDSAIRAVRLASEQVSTIAGLLRDDFTLRHVRAVAARDGKVYVATRSGELHELSVGSAQAPRRVSLCNRPVQSPLSDPRSLEIDALALAGDQLFVLDRSLGGVCRIYLSGKDRDGRDVGERGCSGCIGTWQMVYPSPSLPSGEFDQQRSELRLQYITDIAVDDKSTLYLLGRLVRYKDLLAGQTTEPAGIVAVDLSSGSARQLDTAAPLPPTVWGLAYHDRELFISAGSAHQVLRLDLDDKLGTFVAIGDGVAETRDGAAAEARFCNPLGIVAHEGAIYIGEGSCPRGAGERAGNALRRLDPKRGTLSTLLGPAPRPFLSVGIGPNAGLSFPAALAASTDARGAVTVFVADMWADALVEVD
ncbi:MAG: hypothetical protein KC503_32855 [Myxococcales bacterium]|nr:hypothetical protein [Myxococcales bacterium]